MEVAEILMAEGYAVVEGKEAVLNMIKSASDGSDTVLCSGYKVLPGGEKCKGCPDCESK